MQTKIGSKQNESNKGLNIKDKEHVKFEMQ